MNVKEMGQVFTPYTLVKKMVKLRRNKGSILEPSAGAGAFLPFLGKKAVGIELDKKIAQSNNKIHICDFFEYSREHKFQTIIGNPPYVRFQDISKRTKSLLPMNLFDQRSNLYLFFIAKSIEHLKYGGELIFITPRDFLKSTTAKKLNKELYSQGSFTDFYELGDAKVFNKYSPNCAIWRWEKGLKNKKLSCGRLFFYSSGQIWFGNKLSSASLANYFDVKVGAVSGADDVFSNRKYGNIDMVCSRTRKTGEKRTMIYNKKCRWLKQFKNRLLSRKIKPFNQSNWWQWGRSYHAKEGERIYVNCKTRNPKPFFVSEAPAYDGSVLALFPKNKDIHLSKAADKLNKMNWQDLGFVCGGRLLFSQKSLQNAPVEVL